MNELEDYVARVQMIHGKTIANQFRQTISSPDRFDPQSAENKVTLNRLKTEHKASVKESLREVFETDIDGRYVPEEM
jgi:hypothetical protein